jgi:hypothetical protein
MTGSATIGSSSVRLDGVLLAASDIEIKRQ